MLRIQQHIYEYIYKSIQYIFNTESKKIPIFTLSSVTLKHFLFASKFTIFFLRCHLGLCKFTNHPFFDSFFIGPANGSNHYF